MPRTIDPRLADVPLVNLKADVPARQKLTAEEQALQKVTPPDGALVELAMRSAGVEAKQLADAMGISTSLLLRGFKDTEHLSWQRLRRAGLAYPRFRQALLEAQAHDTEGVEVITEIRVRKIA